MKKLLILCAILSLSSCEVSKKAAKQLTDLSSKTDTATQVDTVNESNKITERTVEGGNIKTNIPSESNRERDENGLLKELVQEIKDGGLTKTIYYKSDGSVDVDCRLAEMFERIQEQNVQRDNSIITMVEQLELQIKLKDSEKTESVSPAIILYAFIGMTLLILIVGGGAFYAIKKQGSQIIDIATKLNI